MSINTKYSINNPKVKCKSKIKCNTTSKDKRMVQVLSCDFSFEALYHIICAESKEPSISCSSSVMKTAFFVMCVCNLVSVKT